MELLDKWCKTEQNELLHSIQKYVNKKSLIKDLIKHKILDESLNITCENLPHKLKAEDLFVIWVVSGYSKSSTGDSSKYLLNTWRNEKLFSSWIKFCYENLGLEQKFCFHYGEKRHFAPKHSSKIYGADDGHKIISSNDERGFTFRGRAIKSDDVATLSVEASYKLHGMLRWLHEKGQRITLGDIEIYIWANANKKLLESTEKSDNLIDLFDSNNDKKEPDWSKNFGFEASEKIREKLKGFRNELSETDKISIIIFKLSSKARRSIIYYREILKNDLLGNIEKWNADFAYPVFYKYKIINISPSPRDIVDILFYKENENLKASIYSELLPIQINNLNFPWNLVYKSYLIACNPLKYDIIKRRENISLACSIYKGYLIRNLDKEVEMSLNKNNKSRDYLYGRLLAVAQAVEDSVIKVIEPGSKRETSAERYFQRFSTRPYTTWKVIYDSLKIYQKRYKFGNPEILIGEVMELFDEENFKNDKPLSPEFLLGYHCQLNEIYRKKVLDASKENNSTTE